MTSTPATQPPNPPVAPVWPVLVEGADRGGPAAVLGQVAEVLAASDQVYRRVVGLLAQALQADAAEQVLKVPLETFLSQSCRTVRFERATLLATAETLARMPVTLSVFRDGWLSWSQVRAVTRAVKGLSRQLRSEVDRQVGDLAIGMSRYEPDRLIDVVDDLVDRLTAKDVVEREQRSIETDFLSLQSKLDGSGTLYGEFGPATWTLLEASLTANDNQTDPNTPDSHPDEPDDGHPDDGGIGLPSNEPACAAWMAAARLRRRLGAVRAQRLLDLAIGHTGTCGGDGGVGRGGSGMGPPLVCLSTSLAGLLGLADDPVWLHTVTGGRVKVTNSVVNQWVDRYGANFRGITFDQVGQIIGVGRLTYRPPGWLRQAIWCRDITTTSPTSTAPVRTCDLDHMQPFDPTGNGNGGATDVANLHSPTRNWHARKRRDSWKITRRPNGDIIWHNQVTGYQIAIPPPRRQQLTLDLDPDIPPVTAHDANAPP